MKVKLSVFPMTIFFMLMIPFVNLSGLPVSFWIDMEGGAVSTVYNDVQIPSDTGTAFSLTEDLSAEPGAFFRLEAGADWGRHSLFVLYAPLLVDSNGTLSEDIDFYGETFTAGTEIEGTYKFNSYRLTYAYTFLDRPRIKIAAGITGKIRDAYIALDNGTVESKRTDLGFVPLIHLSAEWLFNPKFSLLLKGDGLAAPQGRAEDFLFGLVYNHDRNLALRAGYRFLEGGSDGGGSVYTFSMFNYFTAGLQIRF